MAARFLAYGWNVLRVGDANDIDRIEHALDPTFLVLDSHIGYGSPHKQDTPEAHVVRSDCVNTREIGFLDESTT